MDRLSDGTLKIEDAMIRGGDGAILAENGVRAGGLGRA
jgi:hypothetical protein